jgi:hypothetical protein
MKVLASGVIVISLLISTVGLAGAVSAQSGLIPTIAIISVDPGVSVTIQTAGFPPSQSFTVSMGKLGTLGIGGFVVATTDSGNGGEIEATNDIPPELQNDAYIAIRMQSDQGYFSYNLFSNQASSRPTLETPAIPISVETQTSASTAISETPTPTLTSTVTDTPVAPAYIPGIVPTISILNVIPDQQVTIQTVNFPPGQTFKVTMGRFGTQGINGIEVASTDSGAGGSLTETYSIPPELAGQSRIAIRLQSSHGFFSYDWFENASLASPAPTGEQTFASATTTTTPVVITPAPGEAILSPTPLEAPSAAPTPTAVPISPGGIPSVLILSVVQGQNFTISAVNFPPGQTVHVLLGLIGTQGSNGIEVGQIDSGSGAPFQATLNIPPELSGKALLAIRLQSDAGYYAYNWFDNLSTR